MKWLYFYSCKKNVTDDSVTTMIRQLWMDEYNILTYCLQAVERDLNS